MINDDEPDDDAIGEIIALRQRAIDFLGPPRRYISDYDLACFLKAEAKVHREDIRNFR